MKDLNFIKECENCHHNISYSNQDLKLKREFLGYSVVYNEWGDGNYDKRCSSPCKTLAELAGELKFLATGKSLTGNKFKIFNILAVFSEAEVLQCPNCLNEIIIKKKENTFRSIDLKGNVESYRVLI